MSHSVIITMIADQEVQLLGNTVNIHDIHSITLNSCGKIISYGKRIEPAVELDVCDVCGGKDPYCPEIRP